MSNDREEKRRIKEKVKKEVDERVHTRTRKDRVKGVLWVGSVVVIFVLVAIDLWAIFVLN